MHAPPTLIAMLRPFMKAIDTGVLSDWENVKPFNDGGEGDDDSRAHLHLAAPPTRQG